MAHYTPTIREPSHVVSNSYINSIKPTKMMDIHDNSSTDHSIFIGYGTNAKRIKDRWEATKKQLRVDNNYVALKWLLDNFVDDYLRSKNMEDTATLTRNSVSVKREQRIDESSTSQRRRPASHSPSKTRFEEVVTERRENGIIDKPLQSNRSEPHQRVPSIKEHRSGEGSRIASDLHIPGQYPYKFVQDYWSPYYHWHGNVNPLNSRMVNVVPGYSGYMIKTPSCSSLPTHTTHKLGGVLRTSESLKQLNSSGDGKCEKGESSMNEKRPPVNLGFKTKSMPNLQFIPKPHEGNSEDEEEIESDPESQGDLLSASSLSMPNLRKIPPDRPPLLSPPSRRHYEPVQFLRDRHDVGSASSFSMPNLKAIEGIRPGENDDRKKTIRDFVINRLTKTDHEQAELQTKIFNPNGYYQPSAMHDSERKLVIRERLLNRLAKRKREENTRVEAPGFHHNGKMTSQVSSHLKFAKHLPRVAESRVWSEKSFAQAPRGARMLGKEDHANNNWKVPQAVGSSEQQSNHKNMWNRSPVKKSHSNSGIWNPADVHVKTESSSPASQDDVTAAHGSSTSPVNHPDEDEHVSRPSSTNATGNIGERPDDEDSRDSKENEEMSGDEEEHVDVENVKEDENEESGESESDPDEDASEDEKMNKRTRKTDKPRKRLKAI